MLLALDIGNTNITIGLFRAGALLAARRAATNAEATADEVELLLDGLLGLDGIAIADLDAIALASVVPSLSGAVESIAQQRDLPFLAASAGTIPLAVRVERPGEVGADRLVNALAAARLHGTPAVVVDFGTATTFDVVTARGEYSGGVIVPGIAISAEALFEKAARLARVEIRRPEKVVGKTTSASIQSGLYFGYLSLVDGVIDRIVKETGGDPRVIATGGLAELFAGASERIETVDPLLTLKGLRLIYERNRGG